MKIGADWVHLRTCQQCGVTLCCDSSPISAPAAVVCMLTAVAVSLIGASLLYVFVERPSVELSSQLKQKSRRLDPLPDAVAEAAPQS